MDGYDKRTNLEKKIFPIVLPSMVEAENFSDFYYHCLEVTHEIVT